MLYYFNATNNHLINPAGTKVTARPRIAFATTPVWTIQFCNFSEGKLIPLDLSNAISWRAAIDCDHKPETAPMCRSLSENIDIDDLANGYVTVKLDAGTETFYDAVKGREERTAWFELWGLDQNGEAIHYCKFQVGAIMPIDPVVGSAPAAVSEIWADRFWVEARLRGGFELQYSDMSDPSDESDWSDSPEGALWYRFRNREVGGLWSDPVKLLPGEKGNDGAAGPTGPTGATGAGGQNAPLAQYQYSADGSTWSEVYADGDTYCRISNDDGISWTPTIRIKGEASNISSLSDLSDVSDLSDASDGQALVYNEDSGTWKPGTVSTISGDSLLPAPSEQDVGKVPVVVGREYSPGNDANAVLLFHMEDSNFTDSAAGSLGQPAVRSVNGAMQFAGALFGNGLRIPNYGEAIFDMPSGFYELINGSDWTIDFRIKFNSSASTFGQLFTLSSSTSSAYLQAWEQSGILNIVSNGRPTGIETRVTTGVWYHVAFVYNGTAKTLAMFLDGNMAVGFTPYTYGTFDEFSLGSGANRPINWIMDEFRVSDIMRWNTDFTPPSFEYGADEQSTVSLQYQEVYDALAPVPITALPENTLIIGYDPASKKFIAIPISLLA